MSDTTKLREKIAKSIEQYFDMKHRLADASTLMITIMADIEQEIEDKMSAYQQSLLDDYKTDLAEAERRGRHQLAYELALQSLTERRDEIIDREIKAAKMEDSDV